MYSTELFVLGLSVLNHEPDTHKVFADILEEQGELGMAQWARSKKTSRQKRLDFVLAVLPCKVGLQVACAFAERAFELRPSPVRRTRGRPNAIGPGGEEITDMIVKVRSIRNSLMDVSYAETLPTLLSSLSPITYDRWGSGAALEMLLALHTATSCLLKADEMRAVSDYKGERKHVTECRANIRNTGKAARQVVIDFNRQANRGFIVQSELTEYPNWQYEYLQKFLTELIEQPLE